MASKLKLTAPACDMRTQPSVAGSRVLAAGGFALFALFALILTLRRIAGEIPGTLSFGGYLAVLIVCGLVSAGLKAIAEWPPHRLSARRALQFGILIELPAVATALVLWPGMTAWWWLIPASIWLSVVAWFCISPRSIDLLGRIYRDIILAEIEQFLTPSLAEEPRRGEPARESLLSIARIEAEDEELEDELDTEEDTDGLVSRMVRRTTETGSDTFEGTLAATFLPGSRQTVLHVPFTPAFSSVPQVDCEIADGSDVRLKVAAVFEYGARLELKRSDEDLEEQTILVVFYASHDSRAVPSDDADR